MNLTGQLSDKDKWLFKNVGRMIKDIISQAQRLRPHVKGQAVEALLACAVSYHASIGQLVEQKMTSSAAVFSLTRSVLESALSILAFCKDPDARSLLYINWGAVLDWKTAVWDSPHIGRPFLRDTPKYRQDLDQKRSAAEKKLREFGLAYMKKKGSTRKDLEAAIAGGKVNKFRDKWYPEGASELLTQYNLQWVYDVLYKRFCSHVHADIGSIAMFGSTPTSRAIKKSTALGTATCMMLLGARPLIQKLGFRVSALHSPILDVTWGKFTA